MAKKKKIRLEQAVQASGKTVLEQNRPWFEQFFNAHYAGAVKKKAKAKPITWVSVDPVAAGAFLFLTEMFLGARLPESSDSVLAGRHAYQDDAYESGKIATVPAHISGVNASLRSLELDFQKYHTEATRFYDSVSDDTLYYRIRFSQEATSESGMVAVYVNPDFRNQNRLPEKYKQSGVPGSLTVMYHTNTCPDAQSGAPVATVTAVTERGGVTVYCEYRRPSAGKADDFTKFFTRAILAA